MKVLSEWPSYLEHFQHLVLVSEQENTSVFTWNVLHLGNDGVDNGGLELIVARRSTTSPSVKHVGLSSES